MVSNKGGGMQIQSQTMKDWTWLEFTKVHALDKVLGVLCDGWLDIGYTSFFIRTYLIRTSKLILSKKEEHLKGS